MVVGRQVAFKFFDHICPSVAYYWDEHAYFFLYKRRSSVEVTLPILYTARTHCADYAIVYNM